MNRRLNLLVLATVVILSATFSIALAEIEDEADPYKEFAKDPKGVYTEKVLREKYENLDYAEKFKLCYEMKEEGFLAEEIICLSYAADPDFDNAIEVYIMLESQEFLENYEEAKNMMD